MTSSPRTHALAAEDRHVGLYDDSPFDSSDGRGEDVVEQELAFGSADDKHRALELLDRNGYSASSGPIRVAYPFTATIQDVSEPDEALTLLRTNHIEAEPIA